MRKYIFIAVSLLAILSCVKESVAPEQRITGIFALDDGSGLSDEYIEFKNGYLTTYSLRPKQKTFAEGKFWNASENDFYLDVAWRYSIIEDDLKADGKSRGKISISEDALKIGESTYTRLKGFESDYYSVIKPERTSAEVSYQAGTGQFSFSIENPVEGDALSAQCESDWVHDLSVDGDNVSFSYEENNTGAARTAVITCSCSGAKAVSFTLAQSGMPVTNLTLNKTSLEMNVGSSETLVATVTPSDATLVWSSTNTEVATVDGNGKVTAKANGTTTIAVKGTEGSVQATCSVTVVTPKVVAVDLGLSVMWASCNLGASTPEGYGDYYAWGATEPWYKDGYAQSSSPQWKSGKSGGYSWANCPFNGGNSSYNSSYWNAHKSECVDANNTLLPAKDAAHVNLGGNWRMPTAEEFDELKNTSNCSWTWTTLNGIKGYKVRSKKTGYTENWIFLPAAGDRDDTNLDEVGGNGIYWSSSLSTYYPGDAWYLGFHLGYVGTSYYYRYHGLSVRPVTEYRRIEN